ncbi:Gfo/Idh/MocA family protein [Steroidobacter sp.]|uniref:Gfo/Idh/MocA family protein n=1 Tax=Steroidobacter sp. TaxID=1978227 RepID=UPI001A4289C5|nr:Gfo/Idh/MocA family oxidoreductase [Steroidobacter sp.]MBL8269898.1 Gfo/Idh/MocA family oxidoreductase [Steroidobacter sp.]
MSNPLRAAIIGTGFIGQVHVRSARLAGAEVVGVAASNPERSAAAAKSLNVPRAFASGLEAARDKDVDVIHICTPNSLHAEVAKAALEAGKHVVCEKPLATSLQDARMLTELAKSKGLIGTVPFINRYHPMVREARSRTQSAETGKLYLIQGSYLQDWLMQAGDTNWRVDASAGGKSRAFADIGSHLCDVLEWITGDRFDSLIATLGTPIAQRSASASRVAFQASGEVKETKAVDTEDVACLILRTERGTLATLTVSQVSAGRKNRLWFELDGAEQSVMFDLESPEQLWIGRREGMTLLTRDPSQGSAEQRRLAWLPAGHAQGWGDCFEAFVRDSYAAMRGESHVGLPTFADGARSMSIVEAVLRSSASNQWTSIND